MPERERCDPGGGMQRLGRRTSGSAAASLEAGTIQSVLEHLHAAALLVLDAKGEEACDHTTAALMMTNSLTSGLGALTSVLHGVIEYQAGNRADIKGDVARPLKTLLRDLRWFPSSPEVAYVIGGGVAMAGMCDIAREWAFMILECADETSDPALTAVFPLVLALAALREDKFEEARVLSQEGATLADKVALEAFSVRARAMEGLLGLLLNEADPASGQSTLILPAALWGGGGALRLESQVSMALSDLIAGENATASAWLRSAGEVLSECTLTFPFLDISIALMATMSLLTDSGDTARRIPERARLHMLEKSDHGTVLPLLRGVAETDLARSEHQLGLVTTNESASVLTRVQAELCIGARFVREGGAQVGARAHLERALATARATGLHGIGRLVQPLLAQVPAAVPSIRIHQSESGAAEGSRMSAATIDGGWRLRLLGDFAIEGETNRLFLPRSVALQALKLVTVRRRITVDELVDVLWPDSCHDVGNRRLRNVLWRIRSVCGDLVCRDGSWICLSESCSTDVEAFEKCASAALSGISSPEDAAISAMNASGLYRGPLLPGDLFVDWTIARREHLALLHLRVLDFLLARALDRDDINEALGLLEQMIVAEPFEETHYVQAAEIYARSGRSYRARVSLDRAERMLGELGMEPSLALVRARRELSMAPA